MPDQHKVYPQVFPNMEDWPIYKLSRDRRNFVQEIDDFTLQRLQNQHKDGLDDLIASTVYQERIRLKEEPWKVDPPNDGQFWNRIRKRLTASFQVGDAEEIKDQQDQLVKSIIHRYSEEIVGTFNIATFQFARRFLTIFFGRLLNTAAGSSIRGIFQTKHQLVERLKPEGDLDTIRALFEKGTVVLVPTHFSNLDSILIGYSLDTVLGWPAFSYGAGLNLYNNGAPAYFMNRLGAYRVDRRKKNPIYLETLKGMSNLSLQRGTNSLFFPGGTRSRSGSLETKLKMGLLGTVVEAQRAVCQQHKDEKIFVVPLVLGYHFVLEAKYLIEQHLKITGKEHYLKGKDASTSIRQWFKFAWQLFSQGNDIVLSFGKPFDVLGNFVDANGDSFDKFGKKIDIKDYFTSHGEVQADLQKESEYTKILADRIVERFHADNVVLSSHVVAFVAFNMLCAKNKGLDLYAVLRLPSEDYIFPRQDFFAAVETFRTKLYEYEKQGKLKLSTQINKPIDALIKDGIQRISMYHVKKPLTFNKQGDIESDDFNTLYYYHNRLSTYHISGDIDWAKFKVLLEG